MTTTADKLRPNTLVNLGEFVRGEISAQHGSPPVNVPKRSKQSSSRPISSAPAAKYHKLHRGPVGYESGEEDSVSRGYSASLIAPVMDDGEILSTSRSSVSSSVMQRHRDAAMWGYGTLPQVPQPEKSGGEFHPINSLNFENECIKIQERNEAKRQDHSTS